MDIEKRIIVGPTDTDSYNIVHHPQYFVWIEEAVLEWLLSTYGSLVNIGYEVEKFNCKFLSPGLLYDPLLLRLMPKGRSKTEQGETIKFQVKLMKDSTKAPVLEGMFFVNIRGTVNE